MSDIKQALEKLSPEKRALLEARLSKQTVSHAKEASIPRRDPFQPCPLSFAQQRLWFVEQMQPGTVTYSMPKVLRLRGQLNIAALEQSLTALVNRHEALRTTFEVRSGEPVQVIAPPRSVQLPVTNLRGLPAPERQRKLDRLVGEEAQRPFNLAWDSLMRCQLLQLDDQEYVLLLNQHHIVTDGWSHSILVREMAQLYEGFVSGRPVTLPELPIQYGDFAVWQRQWLKGEALAKPLAYWKEQLREAPAVLELPTDYPRPAVQTFRGGSQAVALSGPLSEALQVLSRRQGVTVFMTLLAAFKVLLYRYTGRSDILVGSPVANRNRVELEGLIGFFVNMLVLRTSLEENPTFEELLRRVRETALGAYSHQDLPFEKLVEELQPARNPGHNPLFQVAFVFDASSQAIHLPGLTVGTAFADNHTSKFDLTMSFSEAPGGLSGSVEYNAALFEPATISRMIGHFQNLLEAIVVDPTQRIGDLPILSRAERDQLLFQWNQTQTAYPRDRTIPELFEEQVEQRPDAIAVVFGEQQLSYAQLNERANELAHQLRRLGVGPEVLVGLCVERSVEMIVGLLAILKAGGAYVPLDASYPPQRLAFMVEDTRMPLILSQRHLLKRLPQARATVLCLNGRERKSSPEPSENPASGVKPDQLAYVTYTSGSTGRPKGVAVPHRGVVRLIKETNYASLTPDEVLLQMAPISFDASTFEIWGVLLNGGKLVVMPPDLLSLAEIGEAIRKHHITTLWVTTGLFYSMVDERLSDLKPLRQLLTGGEMMSVPHMEKARRELRSCRLIHCYGPTENTTFTCCYWVPIVSRDQRSIPIGRPISNTQVYLLDHHLQPAPVGVVGELCLGGDGLAHGYLNRPELSKEKFIPHPFSEEPGARLYKTGDLARYRPDGNIEFVGRMDQQVKIRGFRIELGEIESVLNQHPHIRESVVMVREDHSGEKTLVAYVVTDSEQFGTIELSKWLKEKLPDYMVPAAFVLLTSLPLTPNGKVDRNALPAPKVARSEGSANRPWLPIQHQIIQIWEELLGVHPIGIRDNFFALGGHSLLAVRMIDQVERVCGRRLPLATLFAGATVEELAQALLKEEKSEARNLIEINSRGHKTPLFFLHGDLFGGGFYCMKLAQMLGSDQPFYAIPPHTTEGLTVPTVEEMAADHIAALRACVPAGPYVIGGFCMAGVVALEMARQLQRQGEVVTRLILIDASSDSGCLKYVRPLINWWGSFAGLNTDAKINRFYKWSTKVKLLKDFWRANFRRKIRLAREAVNRRKCRVRQAGREDSRASGRNVIGGFLWSLAGYRCAPTEVPTTILWSEGLLSLEAAQRHWQRVVSSAEVISIPGEHLASITAHVQALALKMGEALNRDAGDEPRKMT